MAVIEKDNRYYMSDGAGIFYGRKAVESVHTHQFVEMVYTAKGKCTHIIDGIEYPVRHGDMVIINYNQTHEIKGEADVEYVNILIKPEYINNSLGNQENAFALLNLSEFADFSKILDKSKCKITFSGEERDRIENVISLISNEQRDKMAGYELIMKSQFNILLIMIFRKMSFKLDNAFTGVNDALLSYINRNCHEKLSLEDIAKKCSYNTAYFSRKFKDFAGMTFTAYLKKTRIEKAKAMVEKTDMEIADIINSTGYTDRTKFFAHFKEATGMTPLEYRRSKK